MEFEIASVRWGSPQDRHGLAVDAELAGIRLAKVGPVNDHEEWSDHRGALKFVKWAGGEMSFRSNGIAA